MRTAERCIAHVAFDCPVAVLGDIHGCVGALARLLKALGERKLLVLGDVCDRGPDSRAVIEQLVRRGARGVRGNHEQWLIDWAQGKGVDPWALRPEMGGQATLVSYGIYSSNPKEIEAQRERLPLAHLHWLEELALIMDLDVLGARYWLIHAGLPPSHELQALSSEQQLYWLVSHKRTELLWEASAPEQRPLGGYPVIMGHVPVRKPLDLGGTIALDTGAGSALDGRLTALLLPERRFVSVPAE